MRDLAKQQKEHREKEKNRRGRRLVSGSSNSSGIGRKLLTVFIVHDDVPVSRKVYSGGMDDSSI